MIIIALTQLRILSGSAIAFMCSAFLFGVVLVVLPLQFLARRLKKP